MDIALKNFFSDYKPGRIFSYKEFNDYSAEILKTSIPEELNEKELINYNYRKINLQRTRRINKTFMPKPEMIELIEKIKEPQLWLMITEDWCGDSAQNLPFIINYINFNPFVRVEIILRDENLEAIDNYFTEGNPRSIPKIVGFDKHGRELFIWGPRPRIAQDLVSQLKAEGYSREEFNKELHLWYARNKGKELEKELISIFKDITRLD